MQPHLTAQLEADAGVMVEEDRGKMILTSATKKGRSQAGLGVD